MIIDGNKIAQKIYDEMREEIKTFTIKPTLGVILVGNNPASLKYIDGKKKWAEYVGIKFILARFTEDVSEKELLDKLKEWNESPNINGYIVQLPLPEHINTMKILNTIHPKKDVDGFHPNNQGKVLIGDTNGFMPCTPAGLMELLKEQKVELEGKVVCVVGRSNIVGKPTIALLINAGATIIACNSKTKNLERFTQQADIVIMATGNPKLLKVNMIKVGAMVLDVGFTIVDGKVYGDADTKLIDIVGGKITPVPGGVGALTKAMLMKNTLKAYKLQNK